MNKFGVVLLNMGGPTSLDSIRPFLENLFLDEEIISFGPMNFARKPLAKFIAKKRAEVIKKNYAMIGGKSPIRELSEQQAVALKRKLEAHFGEGMVQVEVGFSYWHPFIGEAFENLKNAGIKHVFLMTLYPHYSKTTTGSCFKTWRNLHRADGNDIFKVQSKKMYPVNEHFVRAISNRIDEALLEFPEEMRNTVHLQFSAHGTPVSLVKQGDPYSFQIQDTVDAVMKLRGKDLPHHLSFQSKVGPAKWLEPNTEDKTIELANAGVKNLLLVPVAFVSDHIETLHELGIELRHLATENGIENFHVTKGLNDGDLYIEALASEIRPKMERVFRMNAGKA
jgi:protoporphyrin/coproporphyrin ferrochelatase